MIRTIFFSFHIFSLQMFTIKKIQFFLLIFLTTGINPCFSQFFFGSNKAQTKSKIVQDIPTALFVNDTSNAIVFKLPEKESIFKIFFDNNNEAYLNVLAPLSMKALNKWIRGMNEGCVAKSDKEWSCYFHNDIIQVKLVSKDDIPMLIAFRSK